jgi:hypothetical protein
MSNWQSWHENRSREDQWGDQWWHGEWDEWPRRWAPGWSQGTAVEDSNVDQNPGGGVPEPPGRAAVNRADIWGLRANQPAVAAAKANPAAVAAAKAVHVQVAALGKAVGQPKAKAKGDPTAVADAGAQVMIENQTAVADAGAQGMIGNQPAVADAGAQCFDLEYFQQVGATLTRTYRLHNQALKWFRQEAEAAGVDSVVFSNVAPNPIAQIEHSVGTDYHFVGAAKTVWRWQDMVAQMDDESMQHVVEGPNHSRGLISCRLDKLDVLDNQRNTAEIRAGRATRQNPAYLYTWDFVVVRDDGTQVWMHPTWSNTKIQVSSTAPARDHEVPRSGPGGTSGPGTFKHFKNKRTEATLRFKGAPHAKANAKPKAKAEAKAEGDSTAVADSTGASSSTSGRTSGPGQSWY